MGWLSRISAPSSASPAVHRLETPNHLYLGGIDGLARAGTRIVGIQNIVGRSRIWSVVLDAEATRVVEADLLLRGHPDFKTPTTGVVVGNHMLFVADAFLQKLLPSGQLSTFPAGRTGNRVLELKLSP